VSPAPHYDPPRPWIASYAAGVPEDLEPVTGSLLDIVTASARDYPDAPALQFFGRTTSYRDLVEAIDRVAAGLRERGVGKGDTVAIVLPNCPQHIIAFYAILRLGAIAVEHNPLYTPRELRKQFEDHGARTAIVWSKVVATVQEFPADLAVTTLVSVDITTAMPLSARLALRLPVAKARESRAALTTRVSGAVPWEHLARTEALAASVPGPATDDVAIIQYTSGTTGTPKGAVLTHRNLLANARQAQAWVPSIQRGHGCVVYAVLPMFHAYGLTLCLTFAMSMGARLVLFPRFEPAMVLQVTRKHPATFLPLVPRSPIACWPPRAPKGSPWPARRSPSPAPWRCRMISSCRSRRRRAATSSRATACPSAHLCSWRTRSLTTAKQERSASPSRHRMPRGRPRRADRGRSRR
jgi:long-chain acyl-CoA synthetase